jgi:hypothetical protein
MLSCFKFPAVPLTYYLSLVCLLGGTASAVCADPTQYQVRAAHNYFEYFIDYFGSLDENADLDEVIDNLIILRQSMLGQGIDCPSIRELSRDVLKYLFGQNVNVDSDVLREFVEKVEQREIYLITTYRRPQIELVRHHRRHEDKNKKGVKMGSKGIFGFVKVLAGALTTLLPIPGAQTIGLGLIIYGINEVIDDTREQGDANEKLQERDEQRRREEEMLKEPVTP